jgi:ectoine hydroxylase-related dioxygenase (phytanoyl-CoA dioxygenase family)
MTTLTKPAPLPPSERQRFIDQGYAIARGLFGQAEIDAIVAEFMTMQAGGFIKGHFEPKPQNENRPNDPLLSFPRVMHPHEINQLALRYLLDDRLEVILRDLFGEEVLAAQSMFYFKPPGARGQALHQDNFYLRVEPGTCVAAWIACDEIDRSNGGLEVVPGTHAMDLFCPEEADASVSFTRDYVAPPPGLKPVPVDLSRGDVLFFNGSLVHGSGPNATADRFRRSFICHYVGRSSEQIAAWYPTRTMDGARVQLPPAQGGGPCGEEIEATGPH